MLLLFCFQTYSVFRGDSECCCDGRRARAARAARARAAARERQSAPPTLPPPPPHSSFHPLRTPLVSCGIVLRSLRLAPHTSVHHLSRPLSAAIAPLSWFLDRQPATAAIRRRLAHAQERARAQIISPLVLLAGGLNRALAAAATRGGQADARGGDGGPGHDTVTGSYRRQTARSSSRLPAPPLNRETEREQPRVDSTVPEAAPPAGSSAADAQRPQPARAQQQRAHPQQPQAQRHEQRHECTRTHQYAPRLQERGVRPAVTRRAPRAPRRREKGDASQPCRLTCAAAHRRCSGSLSVGPLLVRCPDDSGFTHHSTRHVLGHFVPHGYQVTCMTSHTAEAHPIVKTYAGYDARCTHSGHGARAHGLLTREYRRSPSADVGQPTSATNRRLRPTDAGPRRGHRSSPRSTGRKKSTMKGEPRGAQSRVNLGMTCVA